MATPYNYLTNVVTVCTAVFIAFAQAASEDFEAWVAERGKIYTTVQELDQARANFLANDKIIEKMNSDADDRAEYGHTHFSDLTFAEFRRIYLPVKSMDPIEGKRGGEILDPATLSLDTPSAFDWRSSGAVTPVKNQGSCGSCWAESAVGNIESLWYIANRNTTKAPIPLSVEQVIECDEHDNACYGGYQKGAFQYVIEHGGLDSEESYPYIIKNHVICLANQTFNETCGDGMCSDPPLTSFCDLQCRDKAHTSVAKIASWMALPADEGHIAAYLVQHGPVSVGINAAGWIILWPWLQHYKKGIANPRWCSDSIDHGVLLVGFGEENGMKYWIVKNSWGPKWGEAGYFRMIRGVGKCAVALMATSAIVGQSTTAIIV